MLRWHDFMESYLSDVFPDGALLSHKPAIFLGNERLSTWFY